MFLPTYQHVILLESHKRDFLLSKTLSSPIPRQICSVLQHNWRHSRLFPLVEWLNCTIKSVYRKIYPIKQSASSKRSSVDGAMSASLKWFSMLRRLDEIWIRRPQRISNFTRERVCHTKVEILILISSFSCSQWHVYRSVICDFWWIKEDYRVLGVFISFGSNFDYAWMSLRVKFHPSCCCTRIFIASLYCQELERDVSEKKNVF